MNATQRQVAHVEGPWTVIDPQDGASDDRECLEIHDGCGRTAIVVGFPYDAEVKATADLMAAAPDMLEALQRVVVECEFNNPTDLMFESELAGLVRAAIAKAEGK